MQNQVLPTDTVYQSNLENFSSVSQITENSLIPMQDSNSANDEIKKAAMSAVKNFILGYVNKNYTFITSEKNSEKIEFDTTTGQNYIYAEYDEDMSVYISSSNHSRNICRIYNGSNSDVTITISFIADSVSQETASAGWVGVNEIIVGGGQYVEVECVINIPERGMEDMTTIRISDSLNVVR
jgi:hypothetical protein